MHDQEDHIVQHLTLGNITWVALGFILLVLVNMLRARKKHNSSFSYLIFLQENGLYFLIALIGSYTMFYHADSFTKGMLEVHVHEGSDYYSWFGMICGFNGWVIVEQLKKAFK